MSVSNKIANEKLRNIYLSEVINYFSHEKQEEVLQVKSNEVAIPVVDCNDIEKWIVITIKVPTGADKGQTPYDGYDEAENYEHDLIEKEEKKRRKEEEKKKKIEHDKKMREKKDAE